MGKSYIDLGGNLNSADTLINDLYNFKSNDVSGLTLLNDNESLSAVSTKVGELIGVFEDIIEEITNGAREMQEAAKSVNDDGKVEW